MTPFELRRLQDEAARCRWTRDRLEERLMRIRLAQTVLEAELGDAEERAQGADAAVQRATIARAEAKGSER